MLTPHMRRITACLLSLALAALACARAEVALVPVTPDYATRQPATVTLTPLPATATETAQPTPTATEISKAVPSETAAAPDTETPAAPANGETSQAPTDTLAPPTETPASAEAAPTDTPPAAPPGDTAVPATETLPPPTETVAPTNTPVPPTDTPAPIPPQNAQPTGIPGNAIFTQNYTVTHDGGAVVGDPVYLKDSNTYTWAALEGGHTTWTFDLGSPQNITGVRVYPQKPRTGEATTLLAIEVSNDGANWQAVIVGTGDCGEANCDTLAQMQYDAIGFRAVSARYLRLRSGPNRFGFAEVVIALLP